MAAEHSQITAALFDTHAHLDDEQFDEDRDAVVRRAESGGLLGVVAVGTTLSASRKCIELADRYEIVHAAVGIQPNYVAEAAEGDWDAVAELVQSGRVVALGETGLDRHWDYSPFALQQDYFARHLRLSQQLGLPFIVHMRECEEDILTMLRQARRTGPLRGVMHSFTGSGEMAAECVELGLHVSFAGMVTYKKSDDLRQVAADIPADRILVETDCPYLSPHPVRSQRRNEPGSVLHTARCLAEVRGLSLDEFALQTTANARLLFGV